MKKAILFSLALSLLAAPLAVNAATTKVSETNNLQSSKSQFLAGFGFVENIREKVEGTNELINDTEEDSGAINDGAGSLKTKVSGGEDSERDEVVEEVVIEEGTDTSEYVESETSGDSF